MDTGDRPTRHPYPGPERYQLEQCSMFDEGVIRLLRRTSISTVVGRGPDTPVLTDTVKRNMQAATFVRIV